MNKIFPSLFFDHSVTDLDFWSDQHLGSQGGGGGGDILVRILHVGRQDNSNQLSSYVICLLNCSGRALVALSPKGT